MRHSTFPNEFAAARIRGSGVRNFTCQGGKDLSDAEIHFPEPSCKPVA